MTIRVGSDALADRPVLVGEPVAGASDDYQGYFTRFCAGGVLVAIPVTILFLCLQKYYVEGVTGGAVKG